MAPPFLAVWVVLAIARESFSTLSVITEPAAMRAPLPIATGAIRQLFEPTNTSSPISV